MAIAEWPTMNGPADYALFVDTQCVALAEAKRRRKNVSTAIDQAERYSKGFAPLSDISVPGGPWGEFRVPFPQRRLALRDPVLSRATPRFSRRLRPDLRRSRQPAALRAADTRRV